MNKLQSIQALRGIAIIFVILFHLWNAEKMYGGSKTILPDIFQFGAFGVDLFFVISGFIMVSITKNKSENFKEAVLFFYRRLSRIYPIYWLYTCLAIIAFYVQPSSIQSLKINQVSILESLLLLPSHHSPIVQVGWTLIYELYFYIVFTFILFFSPQSKMMITMLSWGACIVFFDMVFSSTNPYFNLICSPLSIEFILGCIFALIYHNSSKIIHNNKLESYYYVLFSLLIIIISSCYYSSTDFEISNYYSRLLIFGIPALLVVYFTVNAERNGCIMNNYLTMIGDASYSIYLSHLFTLRVLGKIWHKYSVNNIYDNIIMLPLFFIVLILVGQLSYHVIEMPLLKFCRKTA